ncbi:restriction endonuclease subunit S [Pseudomonas chlororaphis]|uniref:restriction endonuclease subunit S n=1 Tax=Pseudomonas chlororaphis TaxID=587753 RepID=UPI000F46C574|nr:restriction endonuclease subunit S [Pseudomonas chlororaphis]
MSSEWPLRSLEDIAKEVTVGFVGSMASEYVDEGIPFLRSLNINPFGINKSDLKFITAEFHQKIKKSTLRPGDVVIVRTGKPGTCAVVPDWLSDANCSDLVIVRCGADVRPKFLCYWVNSAASHHISSHLVGAVQQHFNVGAAKKMLVATPSLREQDQVVSVLGSIDDRITLLKETNVTLEATAQALFKSWFIDFDPVRAKAEGLEPEGMDAATVALFPESFEESEQGLIPRGWRAGCVADIAVQKKGSVNPLTSSNEWFEHYSLPAFDDAQSPVVEKGEVIKSSKTPLPEDAVLLSKLNPHIPRVWLPVKYGDNAVCSTEFLAYSPAPGSSKELIYCLLTTSEFQRYLCQLVTGTSNSHQRVKPDQVVKFPFAISDGSVFRVFSNITSPIFDRVYLNRLKIQTLIQLRDTLLPRLVSGQLRLPEATAATEKILSEAI